MPKFTLTPEQRKSLEELKSGIRIVHLGGSDKCEGQLVDTATGTKWHVVEGTNAEEVVDNILELADKRNRPKTASEISRENLLLRQELADLKGESQPTAPARVAELPRDKGLESSEEQSVWGVPQLSSTELSAAIRSRGGSVPDGDKRTGKWREAASEQLKKLEA